MPIYEYECEQCGHIEEALQKFSDGPLTVCPKCSGSLQKLISHSAFHLKGSGWYVTDYAGKTGTKSEKKSSTTSKSSTSSTSGKDSSGTSSSGGGSSD